MPAVLGSTLVPKIITGSVTGPASYATGGFEIDLSASFVNLGWLKLTPNVVGVLPGVEYEIALNTDLTGAVVFGKAVVKILRDRYDRGTVGAVTGQPGGVTVQASKTATATTTGSSHTHSAAHDHPSFTSGTPTAGGLGVNAGAGGPNLAGHTHNLNLGTLAVTTSATTHTHDRSVEYQHDHPLTPTTTDLTLTEVAAATNLSGVTWRFIAIGQGDQ